MNNNLEAKLHLDVIIMSEPMEKTMRIRTYVLKEMLKTEKDYVETLRFVAQVSI